MDALETLLRPVASVLNRNIGEVTRARELCASLAGRQVAVRVRDTSLAMAFDIEQDCVALRGRIESEPDVVITGSLLSLARLGLSDDANAIRDGDVELTGDAEVAEAFQDLLIAARPDVEEELSRVVGDPLAHGAGELARDARRWARDARTTMRENLREYLTEESATVPDRDEVNAFADAVGSLRDDVDRLAARIERLGDRN